MKVWRFFYVLAILIVALCSVSCENLWDVNKTASISFDVKSLDGFLTKQSNVGHSNARFGSNANVSIDIVNAVSLSVFASKNVAYDKEGTIVFEGLPIVGKTVFARLLLSTDDGDFVGISNTERMVEGENYLLIDSLSEIEEDDVSSLTYAITYVLDGGENNDDNPNKYTSGEKIIILEAATKDGFNFGGWWTKDGKVSDDWGIQAVEIAKDSIGDKIFYAKWNPLGVLAIPVGQSQEYTSSELDYKLSGFDSDTMEIVSSSSRLKATAVGSYNITVSLKDPVNYKWDGNTTENKTVQWKIIKKKVGLPIADSREFTYTGKEQTYILSNVSADVSVSGNEQTNAGDYVVTASLRDAVNTEWTDGTTGNKTYNWTISKASYPRVTESTASFTYTGSAQTYEPVNFDGAVMNITGNTKTDVGTTDVTVTLKNTNNTQWDDGSTDAIVLSWTINAVPEPSPFTFGEVVSGDGVSVTGYTGAETSIVVPSHDENGNPVTEIANSAFDGTALVNVVIPEGVTEIYMWAFDGCTSLKSVTLPSTLELIAARAFENCSNLESIFIPWSVSEIKFDAFNGCSNLKISCEREDPVNVTLIGWDEAWNPDNRPVTWGVSP